MRKILLGVLLTSALAVAQVPEIDFETPSPPGVSRNTISADVTGTRGRQGIYYWVVANYPVGSAFPAGPAFIRDAPDTLNGANFVTVRWRGVTGATSYDLLKTATRNVPQAACNCAVATGILVTNQVDNTNVTGAYTIGSQGIASGWIRLNNRDYTTPRYEFSPPIVVVTSLVLTNLTFAALPASANGTVVYCSDCLIANPCAGTGTGAIAKRLNGIWVCN